MTGGKGTDLRRILRDEQDRWEGLYSITEASAAAQRSPRTLRRWIQEGHLHPNARGKVQLADVMRVRDESKNRMTHQGAVPELIASAAVPLTVTGDEFAEAVAKMIAVAARRASERFSTIDWSTVVVQSVPGEAYIRIDISALSASTVDLC